MKIAVDLDTVQNADMIKSWCDIATSIYGGNQIDVNKITDWDIYKFIKKDCPCTEDEFYGILNLKDFFTNLKPRKDCLRVLYRLREFGHEVFSVTATNSADCIKDKTNWLVNKLNYNRNDIIFCNKKHLIRADILIDDAIHNLKYFIGTKILFTAPHNISVMECEYDIRVKSWNDIETYFEIRGWL